MCISLQTDNLALTPNQQRQSTENNPGIILVSNAKSMTSVAKQGKKEIQRVPYRRSRDKEHSVDICVVCELLSSSEYQQTAVHVHGNNRQSSTLIIIPQQFLTCHKAITRARMLSTKMLVSWSMK